MKTDELIDALARETEAAKPRKWRVQLAVAVAAGLAVALVLVVLGLGVRADIGTARMSVMMKALFSAFAAAVVLPLTVQLMKPGRPLGWRVSAVLLFAGLCFLVAFVALMGEMPEQRWQAWMGGRGSAPWCVVLIPILAAPTAMLLTWLMRSFAPTRIALAGAAIGALSGGVGAMAYAMYCPTDSVAFVTTWYTVAIAVCAALGALIGAKFLRW